MQDWVGKLGNRVAVGYIVVIFYSLEIEGAFVIIFRLLLVTSIVETLKILFFLPCLIAFKALIGQIRKA